MRYCINQASLLNGGAACELVFALLPAQETIALAAALPTISNLVTIDATTQFGYAGTPLVTIDGGGMPIDGFDADLRGRCGDRPVSRPGHRELLRRRLRGNAAGSVTIRGNFIGNNSGAGVWPSNSSNDSQGNTIGVTSAGDKAANGVGVLIFGSSHGSPISNGNVIGGPNPGDGNVIDGNTGDGVQLLGPGVFDTTVEGNFIGVNAAGDQELGNGGNGVSLLGGFKGGPTGNVIGAAGAPNVISGNGGAGVLVDGRGADSNQIEGNYIGTDITGVQNLGNAGDGVRFQNGASSNVVGVGVGENGGVANVIAFNAKGVVVVGDATASDTIRGNSIFGNDGPGIDLGDDGPTPGGAPGSGPNGLLAAPVISSVVSDGSAAEVMGFLTAAPNANYQIDLYASPADGPPYQGESFIGSISVATDANGFAAFDVSVPPPPSGWVVDATATDVGDDLTFGDTSEFSAGPPAAFVVTAPAAVDEQNTFDVTVRAVNAFGDAAPEILGTVQFSSNDPRAARCRPTTPSPRRTPAFIRFTTSGSSRPAPRR